MIAETERKQIDWERVELEYRAGKLSIREIARNHSCTDKAIRKRAKAEGWTRDLSEKINSEVRNKLVRTLVRSPAASEREVVGFAADRSVAALRDHHNILTRGVSLIDQMMFEAEKLMKTGEMTDSRMATISKIIVSLSMATKNFIDKERQLLGIPDDTVSNNTKTALSEILDEIGAAGRRLPADG